MGRRARSAGGPASPRSCAEVASWSATGRCRRCSGRRPRRRSTCPAARAAIRLAAGRGRRRRWARGPDSTGR
eukprot:3551375-Pyramimonas_sp.AAC.1